MPDVDDFNIWQQESMHRKILKQFNTPKSQGGFRCDGFEEFPKMLYRAQRHPLGGKFYVALEKDEMSLDGNKVIVDAQAFNRTCQMIVETPEMEERAIKGGWRKSMGEAMQYVQDEELRLATEAAHRNYDDRNMGAKAKAQAEEIELKIHGHVAEIPEQRRVRKTLSPEHKAKLAAGRDKARAAKAGNPEPAV